MGKRNKYRIAIVAEIETEANQTILANNITLSCRDGSEVKMTKLDHLEIEDLDYTAVRLEDFKG